MNDNTKKDFSELSLEEMEARLPKYRGVIDGSEIEETDEDWYKFANLRYVYVEDGSPVQETNKTLLLQLLDMGKIRVDRNNYE